MTFYIFGFTGLEFSLGLLVLVLYRFFKKSIIIDETTFNSNEATYSTIEKSYLNKRL